MVLRLVVLSPVVEVGAAVQRVADTALVGVVLLVEMRWVRVVVLGERLATAQRFEVVVVGRAWLVEVMKASSGWLVDRQTVVALLVETLVARAVWFVWAMRAPLVGARVGGKVVMESLLGEMVLLSVAASVLVSFVLRP